MKNTYWAERRARENRLTAIRADNAKRDFEDRVARNCVVTVLAGEQMTDESVWRFPVIIHNANGSRTYCNHLN